MTLNNDTNISAFPDETAMEKEFFEFHCWGNYTKFQNSCLWNFLILGWNHPKKLLEQFKWKYLRHFWEVLTNLLKVYNRCYFLGVWLDIFQWGIQMSFVMVYSWINRISMLSDLERIQLMLNEDSHYEWIDADKIQKLKKKLLILPLNKLWMVKSLPTVLTVEWKSPVTYLTLLILILNIKRLR